MCCLSPFLFAICLWGYLYPCYNPDLQKGLGALTQSHCCLGPHHNIQEACQREHPPCWAQCWVVEVMDTITSSPSSFALILRYLLDYVAVCSMQGNTTTALLQVKSQVKLQAPVQCLCYLLGDVCYVCVGGREKCGSAICTNLRKSFSRS